MKLVASWLIMLGIAVPVFADGSQGAEAFRKICSQCHGDQGAGSPSADNFYRMKIPRLNSQEVQKMSDAELKEIIMKGRRRMKPPLPGTPFMQGHKVKPELLDEIVLYVRALKKRT
ncbi:MAG TPA: cytochrome c [Bryobacteraceae bacterium]